MKPRVYAAIALDKRQREADMHGLFRVAVNARNIHLARSLARRHGVKRTAFWALSESVAERNLMELGAKVAVIALDQAYTLPGRYRVLKPV